MAGDITWTNEKRKLSQLIPWEHNPRQTRKDQAERMVDSLASFGQVQTIAIGPGSEIYDGHQRKFVWSAAEKFGPDYEVDVRVSSRTLTERERQQLVVYLHKGAAGEWDFDALANGFDVGDLLEWGFEEVELGLAGFDLGEPVPDPGPQIDKAAELQEKWQVQRGQVWRAGRHRLMCGDSTAAGDVERLLAQDSINLVLTDPPYGVGQDYGEFEDNEQNVKNLIQSFMPSILRWPAILLTPGHRCLWDYPRPKWLLAWIHPAGMGVNPWGFTQLHPILAYGDDPYLKNGLGGRPDTLVLAADREGENAHPTSKPLKVWKWLLERGSAFIEDKIFDPFLGSGTTLVACEQTGRIGYGMEIEPKYCAVTLERLSDMSLEPQLVSDE